MTKNGTSKWLFSRKNDLFFLFLPVWITWIIAILLPSEFRSANVPLWMWVGVILLIDVAHVWSSLFRTYLERETRQNHKNLLIWAPIAVFIVVFIVNIYASHLFWTLMAYLAVFHFVKQQIGFLALYKAKSKDYKDQSILTDKRVILFSMLYPVAYWHIKQPLHFNWFADNDFLFHPVFHNLYTILPYCNIAYVLIIIVWLSRELRGYKKSQNTCNWPKILWVLSTAFNWYLGIVLFNSDVVFTITNVVAHGIPYIYLISTYTVRRKKERTASNPWNKRRTMAIVVQICFTVILLSFAEEYFWDSLINRDKSAFFESIIPYYHQGLKNNMSIAFAIAVLSIPQVTHYILDGFIWKNNPKNSSVKKYILHYE